MSAPIEPLPPPDPLVQPEAEEKPDWYKRSAIILLVVAGIFGGFAFLCYRGTYPREMLGGTIGVFVTGGVSLLIAAAGGGIYYYRKKMLQEAEPPPQPS